MKRSIALILMLTLTFGFGQMACGASEEWTGEPRFAEPGQNLSEPEGATAVELLVTWDEYQVRYALNGSPAAQSLLEQLPLTIEVENFSNNEKIFYPPQELNTADTPVAMGGAGTLAYYAPWGDVVMFYGDYNENPSLFELGQIISGAERISQMDGTVTITAAERKAAACDGE